LPRNFIAFFGYDINYKTLGTYINRGVFAFQIRTITPRGHLCMRLYTCNKSVCVFTIERREYIKKKIISLAVSIVIKNNLTNLYTVRVFQPRDIILLRCWYVMSVIILNFAVIYCLLYIEIEKFVKFSENYSLIRDSRNRLG